MHDAFLAAGDGKQLAIERLIPMPVEAGLAENGVESRPVPVALGIGQCAQALINIAHPKFRNELRTAARKMHLL